MSLAAKELADDSIFLELANKANARASKQCRSEISCLGERDVRKELFSN